MSTYDDSSLFLYPSGYKASVLFAQKPMDANGQLAFTRSNDTATRVASNGLIEKVRTNLVPNGLSFNPSTGVLYTTVTSDSPISGVSSTRITKNQAAGTLQYGNQNASASALTGSLSYTISRYFKYDGYNLTTSMEFNNSFQWGGISWVQNINIASTGVTLQTPSNCTSKITNVGNGWYRVDVTIVTGASPSGSPVTYLLKVDSTLSTGQGFLTAAPQFETGDIATDYILTTTAAVSVGPVANIPRIDYLGGGCGKLLLEPQRTNLLQYSESFDNAYWSKGGLNVSANNTTSPDGYINADKITENTTSLTTHYVNRGITLTAASYTFSVFAKAAERKWIFLIATTSADVGAFFDLENGAVGNVSAGYSAKIENYGNGWYKCSLTFTATAATWYMNYLIATANNTYNYSGTIGSGIFVWGGQVEVGAYATSYIPTLAASVTRGADSCSKTGISSLIGQTEGVIFLDFIASAQNQDGAAYSVITIFGTSTDNMQLYTLGTTLRWYALKSGVIIFDQTADQTLVAGQRYKVAFAYKSGDWALYINGVQKRTRTETNIPATSQFNFNSDSFGVGLARVENKFNQAILFKTRLPNSELASLTAL